MSEWRKVEDWPYEVSAEGKVRSTRSGTLLKLYSGTYLTISLYFKGSRRTVTVHRLVALTFIPNPEGLPCINHINGNKQDNRVSTLEWCTYADNSLHAIHSGLWVHRSSFHSQAKLDEISVANIRERASAGESQRAIAKSFGISQPLVSGIVRRTLWKDVV